MINKLNKIKYYNDLRINHFAKTCNYSVWRYVLLIQILAGHYTALDYKYGHDQLIRTRKNKIKFLERF